MRIKNKIELFFLRLYYKTTKIRMFLYRNFSIKNKIDLYKYKKECKKENKP